MTPLPAISKDKLILVTDLYLNKKLCVREIAESLKVSPDAVTSFFRRHKIQKRTFSEAQQVKFQKSTPSFLKRKLNTQKLKELAIIGTMLYWGEGYKGNERIPAQGIDFANSDYKMILLFLEFLRKVFILDEGRFRIYLYCYSDQNVSELINFWSKLTKVSKNQFSKPYIRKDFNAKSNKMAFGLIHVRYHDKKLLLEIKSMIESYVLKYAPIV